MDRFASVCIVWLRELVGPWLGCAGRGGIVKKRDEWFATLSSFAEQKEHHRDGSVCADRSRRDDAR